MVFIEAKTKEDVVKAIDEHEKIILDFSSPTCHPCHIFEAVVKQMMETYKDINVVKIDVYSIRGIEYRGQVIDEDVSGVPHIMFFENGEKKCETVGYGDDIKDTIIEEWFRLVRVFLMDFRDDIYNFARVGDRIIELKTGYPSRRVLVIKDKVYNLSKICEDDKVEAEHINGLIKPRKIGMSYAPVTKWLIEEIKR